MTETAKTFSFGDFELDAERRLLFKKGMSVALNSKTFNLLLFLVEHRGRVLSKDQLLEKVWAGQFVEENNLAVQVSALRKIFGERKDEHRYIVTVPGERVIVLSQNSTMKATAKSSFKATASHGLSLKKRRRRVALIKAKTRSIIPDYLQLVVQ